MPSSEINYYDLLGVTIQSTEKEITKAYRKKALACHPDKNPDNPKAAELFHQISEALKVLTDVKAKAAFDKVLKAKEAARLRTQAFDAKRKRFKEDLEKRERNAELQKEVEISDAEKLAAEIERLREEGSRLVREQQELIAKQLAEEKRKQTGEEEENKPKLKVKWKASARDRENGGYNEHLLMTCFQKYGKVTGVVVSAKKNGLAIIEFETPLQANMAFEFEKGRPENPLSVCWLDGKRASHNQSNSVHAKEERDSQSPRETNAISGENNDFESIVLMRMRQAEERKRLTRELLEQDATENTEQT